MKHTASTAGLALIMIASSALPSAAADDGGPIEFMGVTYPSYFAYVQSEAFREYGMRCGTPGPEWYLGGLPDAPGDCSLYLTNPDPAYAPGSIYEIPVVVHIITADDGVTGNLTDQMVQSQIDVLNEDYLAIAGTAGGDGAYTGVQFVLATEDPSGNPTTGITRTANTNWFNDNDEWSTPTTPA